MLRIGCDRCSEPDGRHEDSPADPDRRYLTGVDRCIDRLAVEAQNLRDGVDRHRRTGRVERGVITPPKAGYWGDGIEADGLWL